MSREVNSPNQFILNSALEVLSYDEGLRRVRGLISEILQRQNVVCVAINGSAPEVGKTQLSGEIAKGLLEGRIPTGVCSHPDHFDLALHQVGGYREYFDNWRQAAYIFDAWEVPHGIRTFGGIDLRSTYDDRLRMATTGFGLPLKKVDLWVAIFSKSNPFLIPPAWADRPFDRFEDVIICNEKVRRW